MNMAPIHEKIQKSKYCTSDKIPVIKLPALPAIFQFLKPKPVSFFSFFFACQPFLLLLSSSLLCKNI